VKEGEVLYTEAEVRERERAAFVAGCDWTTWSSHTNRDDAEAEALRRYKEAAD
jgi:hypothetical protein